MLMISYLEYVCSCIYTLGTNRPSWMFLKKRFLDEMEINLFYRKLVQLLNFNLRNSLESVAICSKMAGRYVFNFFRQSTKSRLEKNNFFFTQFYYFFSSHDFVAPIFSPIQLVQFSSWQIWCELYFDKLKGLEYFLMLIS